MIPPTLGRFRPFARALCLAAWLSSLSACTTLQVSVAPPETGRLKLREVSGRGYLVRIWPLVDPETYASNFDEFLPGMGIAAVWVEVAEQPGEADAGTMVRWVLRTSTGQKGALSSRQVLDRYYGKRKIRAYSTKVDADAERRLTEISLRPEAPQGRADRHGYLFFPLDARESTDWTRGTTLALVAGRRTILETSFSDAAH